jgi:hypothetical protein
MSTILDLDEAFRRLFETNMAIRPDEHVLVFSDTIRADETVSANDHDRRLRLNATARAAAVFAERTYGNGSFVDFPSTASSGTEPPCELWRATFGVETVAVLESAGLLEKLLCKSAQRMRLTVRSNRAKG